MAKIETSTDEVKPNSGERSKVVELAVSAGGEVPLYQSSLRLRTQLKQKVSWSGGLGPISLGDFFSLVVFETLGV